MRRALLRDEHDPAGRLPRGHRAAVGPARPEPGRSTPAGPRTAITYFRRALASGARPSAVVLDVHPAFLASPYEVHDGWSDLLGFRDCVDMAWTLKDARYLAATGAGQGVPFGLPAARDPQAASLACVPRRARLDALRQPPRTSGTTGATKGRSSPPAPGISRPGHERLPADPDGTGVPVPPRAKRLYIRRFLDLAAAHGIRVYWLVMPLAPALQHAREVKGRDAEYTRFVRSFRGYPNLVVLDARRSGYDAIRCSPTPATSTRRGGSCSAATWPRSSAETAASARAAAREVGEPARLPRPPDRRPDRKQVESLRSSREPARLTVKPVRASEGPSVEDRWQGTSIRPANPRPPLSPADPTGRAPTTARAARGRTSRPGASRGIVRGGGPRRK